jgi:hypothetical protein
MMKERQAAQEAMQAIDNQAESIPRFLEIANLRKCINPIWVSNDVILHPNSKVLHFYHYLCDINISIHLVTYSTNEEKVEALELSNNDFDQPRKMMLDVYTTAKKDNNSLRPVLVSKVVASNKNEG